MYIYKTTNQINGKVYIGQSSRDIENSKDYLGSGVLIKEAFIEFNKKNFTKEIICECETLEELNQAEVYWINKENSIHPNGYNIETGGSGYPTVLNGQWMNNGIKSRIIQKDDKEEYLSKGWQLGITNKSKDKMSKGQKLRMKTMENPAKGKKFMNKGDKLVFIEPKDFELYESKGYVFGRRKSFIDKHTKRMRTNHPMKGKTHSEESKKKIKEARAKQTCPTKGRIWVNKDGNRLMIQKSEVESYINKGYNRGLGK